MDAPGTRQLQAVHEQCCAALLCRSIDANVSHSTWRLLETPAHYFEKVTFACGHRLQLLLVAKVPEERP